MAKPLILVVAADDVSVGFPTPLRREGGEVLRATSGSEALDLIRLHRPTLVIFSTVLRDIDAPLFCRTIRDDDTMKATSLLVVLAEDEVEMGDLCLAAGCNDVVRKPVDDAELEAKIARLTSIPVRKALRTLVKLELKIARETHDDFLLGHSLNVSKSGMLVQTSHVLAPEVPVTLQFYLHHDPEPLRVESQVVRAEFTGGAPRYGMRFVAMAASHRERLERFIDRLRVARPGGKDS